MNQKKLIDCISGDNFARKRELHREAKRFLAEEKLMKAWQILLLSLQA